MRPICTPTRANKSGPLTSFDHPETAEEEHSKLEALLNLQGLTMNEFDNSNDDFYHAFIFGIRNLQPPLNICYTVSELRNKVSEHILGNPESFLQYYVDMENLIRACDMIVAKSRPADTVVESEALASVMQLKVHLYYYYQEELHTEISGYDNGNRILLSYNFRSDHFNAVVKYL